MSDFIYLYPRLLHGNTNVNENTGTYLVRHVIGVHHLESVTFHTVASLLSLPSGHAKEALDLSRMQEQTSQLEYQSKIKV